MNIGGDGDLELSRKRLFVFLDDAMQTATYSLACVIGATGYHLFDNGSYLSLKILEMKEYCNVHIIMKAICVIDTALGYNSTNTSSFVKVR